MKHMTIFIWRLFFSQGTEAKLGIFWHSNKRLSIKTRSILIFNNEHQNKKIDKTVNLLNMPAILFQSLYKHVFETICMPSK